MKKNILLILVFAALCFSCSNDDSYSEPHDSGVNYMVLSDLHYMHPDILRNDGKAFEEYNAEECKLLRESGALLDAAIEKVKAKRPQFVILCGDMAKDGEVVCHQHIASVFKRLEDETGTKVFVVPGNHDMNNPHSLIYDGDKALVTPSATEEQFKQIYGEFGYKEAVERRAGSLDYMAYPTDNIAIIGVDSNEKNTSTELMVQGGLSKEQAEWVKAMAQKAHREGRYVLMAMHHNLVDFYDHAQLIRGANIANARNEEYDNQNLIDDLCAAGIDVVFSGHSHMHSITSAQSNSHTIYSVVTSSLVNLPLAYRCGTIDENGQMTLTSANLKDCTIPGGIDLQKEGEKYWHNLSACYMNEAADKAWNQAGTLLWLTLGLESKEELRAFLAKNVEDVFYTFLLRTSEGNEHLFTPEENYQAAMAAIDTILSSFSEDVRGTLDDVLQRSFDSSLEDIRTLFHEFFHSAYYNYLGSGTVMPDDAIVIQLTK